MKPRILVVTQNWPWPATTGSRLRLSNVIAGLSSVGIVDVFALAEYGTDCPVPDGVELGRVSVAKAPPWRLSPLRRVLWMLFGTTPRRIAGRSYAAFRDDFRSWASAKYDLVWFNRADAHVAFGSCLEGPAIVDLDDLEDRKASGQVEVLRQTHPTSWKGRLQRFVRMAEERTDVRRWARLQQQITTQVDVVVVCSDEDKRALASANTQVLENGGDDYSGRVVTRPVGGRPTVLFVGFLQYTPNADAAEHLVRDVLPHLRARVPDVEVRLVGEPSDRVRALGEESGVVVMGFVDDLATEYSAADVVVVPVRYGGGTRIKILEAFSARVPVVSTPVGAEGIAAEPGEHLLIAEDPQAIADACYELLISPERRASLARSAYALYEERYRWDMRRGDVAELARSLVVGPSGSGPLSG